MSNPIIIGLTGLAGAGKDTVADTLVTHAGFNKIAFADALRAEVAQAFGLGPFASILSDRACKEVPSPLLAFTYCQEADFFVRMGELAAHENPDWDLDDWHKARRSPRQIMQWWGTEYRRAQQEHYWSTRVAIQILSGIDAGCSRWVVTDCRFANEAKAVRRIGGEVWQVIRPGLASVEGGHASETDGSSLEPQRVLVNGSTVVGLMHSTLRMLQASHGGVILPDDLQAAA